MMQTVDRLIEIIRADDRYFMLSRRIALLKLRGPVEDRDETELNEAFSRAMQLRKDFVRYEGEY